MALTKKDVVESAYSLAHRWGEAKGFPSEVKEALGGGTST